jgi:membrane-associated phospholipid phosphatase
MLDPAAIHPLGAARRRRVRAGMLVCVTLFLAMALAAQLRLLVDEESAVQRLAQAARTPVLERPMRAVTRLGSGWVLLPLTAACCLVIRTRHAGLARALGVAGAGGLVVSDLLKVLVIRQRPNTVHWAYPSAHTFGIVVFVGLVLYVLWTCGAPRGWRRVGAVTGALVIVAVGASRVYLNAHWVGDVVGGLASGGAFLLGAVLLMDRTLPALATVAAPAARRLDRVRG